MMALTRLAEIRQLVFVQRQNFAAQFVGINVDYDSRGQPLQQNLRQLSFEFNGLQQLSVFAHDCSGTRGLWAFSLDEGKPHVLLGAALCKINEILEPGLPFPVFGYDFFRHAPFVG